MMRVFSGRMTLFIVFILLIMTFCATALAAERSAIVNNPDPTDRLNLRTQPQGDAPVLGKYYNGVNFEQLDDVKNGWVKVRFGNLAGYMKAEFLVMGNSSVGISDAMPYVKVANTDGTGLHLRQTQSTGARSLGLFKNGSRVRVFGVGETWCHVGTSDGQVGFMLRDKLSPTLDYDKASGASSVSGSGSGKSTEWPDPSVSHAIASWPIKMNDYVATVNNPNPDDRLHLRVAKSEKSASLGKYYNGVKVVVQGEIDKEWTQVAIGKLHGYMKSAYLAFGDAASRVSSAMPVLTVSNPGSSGKLNLREKPTVSSKSLGLYPNGTEVVLIGFGGEWAHVVIDGQMGFMLASYLN